MIAVWALVAFIGTIVAWNALLKRNIGESMIAGFIVVGIFAVIADGFHEAWTSISEGVLDAMQEEVTFAGLAFCHKHEPVRRWRSENVGADVVWHGGRCPARGLS